MKDILARLFEHQKLSREEAKEVLLHISKGAYNHVQVSSFITVYNMRPITLPELQGFRDAMLELCVPFDLNGMDTIDIVGTGGDGKNTFNISTLSCVVVAGAGYKVSKHGSYGVSSATGSSDVLIALGHEFTNDRDTLLRQLDETNMCFLHAPLFHPAMKEVVPVRKNLGMKTFFNMLGPLVNPIQPPYQLFGTFSLELSRMYQYIMQRTGRRFAIVYALDGYDEISLTGDFKLRTNESERILSPEDLGKPRLRQEDLFGGTTHQEAARIFKNVLSNEATPAQVDVVTANAGMAIHCIKPGQSIGDCIAEARESIASGKALQQFEKLLSSN
jgi:anthranilate phosphoribosyltransferase